VYEIPQKEELCPATENENAQKMPEDLEEKITRFYRFIINRHREFNYDLVHIGNMDEIPVWFDVPSAKTVNAKGE